MKALLIFTLVAIILPTYRGQDLVDLETDNGLGENESFRCGAFFAGQRKGDKPRMKIFVLPKRFPTSCPAKDPKEYDSYCNDLFNTVKGRFSWKSPSKKRGSKYTIGDDLCALIRKEAGIRKLPNKRFPQGIEVGFYYNYCDDITWYDTGNRMRPNICCHANQTFTDC